MRLKFKIKIYFVCISEKMFVIEFTRRMFLLIFFFKIFFKYEKKKNMNKKVLKQRKNMEERLTITNKKLFWFLTFLSKLKF